MVEKIRIAHVEPFFGGSHKQWAIELKKYSRFTVDLYTLPGENWRWRMRGGAISLAREYLSANTRYDLILASGMLDVTTFLSLTRKQTSNTPVATYFHENQFAYPWSFKNRDKQTSRDKNYSFINFTSALTSDLCLFNSSYNMDSFLEGCEEILTRHPDHQETECLELLHKKCRVLPLALEFAESQESKEQTDIPVILWNHRWDHDKNPADFFEALRTLKERNIPFRLIVLGEPLENPLPEFTEAREFFENDILHWGYVDSHQEYILYLEQADILPVTSKQEFFGRSAAEAIWHGCYPLLPKRLAYPDLIPTDLHDQYLYARKTDLAKTLQTVIEDRTWQADTRLRDHIQQFKWKNMIDEYDKTFAEIAARFK